MAPAGSSRGGVAMRRGRQISRWRALVALVVGLIGCSGVDLAAGAELKPGVWTWGVGFGFLKDTPDGTALALNANVEALVLPGLSVGPLMQLGFTGDSAQFGLSGQVKYWIDIPGTEKRLKVTPQAGIGFVHNSHRDGDTSFLIPIGAGADYALSDKLSVTGTLLINFTDLDTGKKSGADVMPGFTIGVRF